MHSAGGKSDSPPFTIPKTAPRPKTLSVLGNIFTVSKLTRI